MPSTRASATRHSWISIALSSSPCSAASAIAPWRSATGASAPRACRRAGSARGCPCGGRTNAARRRARRRTSHRDRRARAGARAGGRRRSRGTCTPAAGSTARRTRTIAPSTAPEIDPSPPTTTIAKIRRLTSGVKVWLTRSCWSSTNSAPATPARKPEIANASMSALRARIEYASVARSLSRTPISTRPVRLARRPRTAREREPEHHHREYVELRVGAQRDHAEQVGAVDHVLRQPALQRRVAGVQQVVGGGERERERDHREREAAGAQRRHADDHREHRAERAGREQHEPGVDVPARGHRARERRAEAHERHLPQAHLAGPTGEHHERQADQRVDRDHGDQLHPVVGEEHRDQRDADHEQHAEHPARDPDGGNVAQLGGDRLDLARLLPRGGRRAREPGKARRALDQAARPR